MKTEVNQANPATTLVPGDKFFDLYTGELVEVIRRSTHRTDGHLVYIGKFITGPKNTLDLGEDSFIPRRVKASYPRFGGKVLAGVNRRITSAFAECNHGQHIAHCVNEKGDRTVAITPARGTLSGGYHLGFSAMGPIGPARSITVPSEKLARHTAELFLTGEVVALARPWYSPWINQANREATILVDTLTPTRVRIEYDMPNTGTHGAWRKQAVIGSYIFIETIGS